MQRMRLLGLRRLNSFLRSGGSERRATSSSRRGGASGGAVPSTMRKKKRGIGALEELEGIARQDMARARKKARRRCSTAKKPDRQLACFLRTLNRPLLASVHFDRC